MRTLVQFLHRREAAKLAVYIQQAMACGTRNWPATWASSGATTARLLVSTASMIGGFRNFAGTARARGCSLGCLKGVNGTTGLADGSWRGASSPTAQTSRTLRGLQSLRGCLMVLGVSQLPVEAVPP